MVLQTLASGDTYKAEYLDENVRYECITVLAKNGTLLLWGRVPGSFHAFYRHFGKETRL